MKNSNKYTYTALPFVCLFVLIFIMINIPGCKTGKTNNTGNTISGENTESSATEKITVHSSESSATEEVTTEPTEALQPKKLRPNQPKALRPSIIQMTRIHMLRTKVTFRCYI